MQILAGVRVVEIGQAFAGPFSAEILAFLGAEVIKIERTGKGDDSRRWGPPFWGDTATPFHAVNRNKHSMELDLRSDSDLQTLKNLIGSADVFIHNLRPGAVDKMGFGAKQLLAEFPRLICAEISAFGHTGPLQSEPGYELLAQAFSGIMSITGEAGRTPVRAGPSVCDFGSAMWLAVGVLAALHQRHTTGLGGQVQTSLFETALAWTGIAAGGYLASGTTPGPMGAGHPLVSPYGYFETRTGPIILACASDALFVKLANALGQPGWVADDRFKDNPARVRNKGLIEGLVADILQTIDREDAFERLTAAGVPCSPLNTIPEVLAHPQTQSLGILNTDPTNPEIQSIGFPLVFNGQRPQIRSGAPNLGAGGDIARNWLAKPPAPITD